MKRVLLFLGLLCAASPAGAALIHDAFDYPTGNLGGNVNSFTNEAWTASTAGTGDVMIAAVGGELSYSGRLAPVGNLAELSNQRGKADRLGTNSGSVTLPSGTGTLYYSLLLRATDFTNFTGTTGAFVAGFNNNVGTAVTGITQAGARLQIRKSAGGYNLGIRNDVTPNGTANIDWDTTEHLLNDTVFVVAAYEFNQGSSIDDVAKLWLNPASGTWGAAVAPAADRSSTGGDISQLQIQNFFLRQVSGALTPRNLQIDDLRIGTSWEEVTRVEVPEPAGLSLLGLCSLALLKRRR